MTSAVFPKPFFRARRILRKKAGCEARSPQRKTGGGAAIVMRHGRNNSCMSRLPFPTPFPLPLLLLRQIYAPPPPPPASLLCPYLPLALLPLSPSATHDGFSVLLFADNIAPYLCHGTRVHPTAAAPSVATPSAGETATRARAGRGRRPTRGRRTISRRRGRRRWRQASPPRPISRRPPRGS